MLNAAMMAPCGHIRGKEDGKAELWMTPSKIKLITNDPGFIRLICAGVLQLPKQSRISLMQTPGWTKLMEPRNDAAFQRDAVSAEAALFDTVGTLSKRKRPAEAPSESMVRNCARRGGRGRRDQRERQSRGGRSGASHVRFELLPSSAAHRPSWLRPCCALDPLSLQVGRTPRESGATELGATRARVRSA